MKTYRRLWLLLLALAGQLGLVVCAVSLHPVVFTIVTISAAGAGALAHPYTSRWAHYQGKPPRTPWHSAALAGVATPAAGGLLHLLGPAAGTLLIATLAAGWLPLRRAPATPPARPAPPADDVHLQDAHLLPLARGWSDARLCWEWRHSHTRLQQAPTTAAMTRVAEQRRVYLDELARRDPTGYTAWITAGALAASDPTPYLTPPAERGAPTTEARGQPAPRDHRGEDGTSAPRT